MFNQYSAMKKRPETLKAEVIENIRLSEDIYQIKLKSDIASKKALPGQFVSILCEDLVLRRPFSIADANNDLFQIIYKVKGKGTKYISQLKPGNEVDFIGPLGKGFRITPERALLIGAGVGVAPLIFLSKILEKEGIHYSFLAGFQQKLNITEINPSCSYIVTEDGSSNIKGRIIDFMEDIIEKYKPERIYACGPKPVLSFTANMAIKYNIKSEMALEREFACGTGVCMGCSIEIKTNEGIKNKRICKDGPVFDGETIVW